MKFNKNIFSAINYMKEHSDGHNARVRRLIPEGGKDQLDPFLLFDSFHVKLPGGFPDHPHRGFETVTYLLSGKFLHEDFKGHKGTLTPGSVQWMTAGKGIVHSEIPASETEYSDGYQLWINLPKTKKMTNPNYQEFTPEQIPEHQGKDFIVKVVAGEFDKTKGGVTYSHPIEYLVFKMQPGSSAEHTLKPNWNGFIAVSDGEVEVNSNKIGLHHGAIFKKQTEPAPLQLTSEKGATFLMVSGLPINESIARYGPFVMNTQQEIREAYEDYSSAKNGFEDRIGWKSEIAKLIKDAIDSDED